MSEFTEALHQAGFTAAPIIAESGHFYRFPAPGRTKGKDAYAMMFEDREGGIYGDYTLGVDHVWQSSRMRDMPAAGRELLAAAHKMRAAIVKAEREAEYRRMAEKAAAHFASLPPATDHPYLTRKQIPPGTARLDGERLAIAAQAITDTGLAIQTLQYIAADGEKRFFTGGKVPGSFHTFEGDNKTIYICEGWATGATIHAATGCTVIVAFNAGNLEAVARICRQQSPHGKIIIAGDDDYLTDGNPGHAAATKAAIAISATVILPVFKDRAGNKLTDFNDLACAEGLPTVTAQLIITAYSITLAEWTYDAQNFNTAPPERQWLIKGMFPMGQASLVASMGGLGKSFLLLDLAHKVALNRTSDFWGTHSNTAFGRIVTGGTSVYISAEDDNIEVHIRLNAIDPGRRLFLDGRGSNLIAIPCPSTGISCRLFVSDRDEVKPTRIWLDLVEQLQAMPDIKMIAIDPVQALIAADMNNPSHVQAISSELSRLASLTGAAVIFAHHVKKPTSGHPIETPADARESIRGTGAVVDSVRAAVVIWEPDQTTARDICEALAHQYDPGAVAHMAVVKSNGESDKGIKTLIRADTGILIDRTQDYKIAIGEATADIRQELLAAIQSAHVAGHGFTITGKEGIYARREELPPAMIKQGRMQMEGTAVELCNAGQIAKDQDGYLYVP